MEVLKIYMQIIIVISFLFYFASQCLSYDWKDGFDNWNAQNRNLKWVRLSDASNAKTAYKYIHPGQTKKIGELSQKHWGKVPHNYQTTKHSRQDSELGNEVDFRIRDLIEGLGPVLFPLYFLLQIIPFAIPAVPLTLLLPYIYPEEEVDHANESETGQEGRFFKSYD